MTDIKANNLACGYGRELVLENLSLSAQPGEVLALLGPNGSGKTTLLRALARLLKPSDGSVLLDGKDVWQRHHADVARSLALTPQNERRDWPLTVEQSVRLGRTPHRGWLLPFTAEDRKIVDQAIASASLSDLRDRPITELSGGEWRRMILARALAQQAKALLLDEPTAGLDLKYQVEMLGLTRDLAHNSNLLVIMTLHDLNHAATYADRIALINNKSIVAIGPPAEVLTEQQISDVYEVPVTVTTHPIYGTTLVSVTPGKAK
jgi:iron complex transport system ATP-binding protein